MTVLCRISSLNGSTPKLIYPQPTKEDNKDSKYTFAAVAINTNWLPGKKYTYILEFCGNNSGAGRIDPNPTNPTDSADANVDGEPVKDGKGGDLILGRSIMYNVTIDDWTDSPAQNIDL